MAIPYMKQSDVSMRLHDTICSYKGIPVFVKVNENFDTNTIQVLDFNDYLSQSKKWITCNVSEDAFVTTGFELGYSNIDNRAVYVTRLPCRKQKQGLCYTAIKCDDMSSDGVFYSKGFYDTLCNKYPSLEEAISNVSSRLMKSCAFSKNFCIKRLKGSLITLEFRDRCVATYSQSTGRFTVVPDLKDYSLIMKFAMKIGIQL